MTHKKKIVVQEGLNDIKKGLEQLGYDVMDMKEGNNADTVIYMADGHDISYYGNLSDMGFQDTMSNDSGTLLINAKGKTIEEIRYIIDKKVYSPLFE